MRTLLPRASVRLRLTLLYGGLFLLAGGGLLAVNYALVRSQLTLPFGVRIESRAAGPPDALGDAKGWCSCGPGRPTAATSSWPPRPPRRRSRRSGVRPRRSVASSRRPPSSSS